MKWFCFLLLGVIGIARLGAEEATRPEASPRLSKVERVSRLKAAREAEAAADKTRAEAARSRGPKPKLFHPDLSPFDANRNGFLEPEEIAAYRADFARRRAEAAKQ